VPSSKVGWGEADTKALRDGEGLAGATVAAAAALGFAGVGATVWAMAGAAKMMAASSVDATRRIAWVTRKSPSIGIVLIAQRPANAPERRHNALSFRHLADFARPRDWIIV
jgi:hypothetical protein